MTSVVLQTIHLNYLLTKLNTLRPGFQRKLNKVRETTLTRHGLIGSTLLPDQKAKLKRSVVTRSICITPQVAQARYMSSSMLHCYVIRAICIFKKICIGKEINPKKNKKLPLNYNKNRLPSLYIPIYREKKPLEPSVDLVTV